MRLLPFAKIVFVSTLPPQQDIARLADAVEQEQNLWKRLNNPVEKSYRGRLSGNRFIIKRVINYRNSFRPEISGKITATDEGSIVHIRLSLMPLTLVFLIIWCGFVLMLLLLFLISPLQSRIHIPRIMLGFAYLLTIISFNLEMERSMKDMTAVFRARLVRQADPIDNIH